MRNTIAVNNFLKTSDLLTCNTLIYFKHTLEAIDHSYASRCVFSIKREIYTDEVLEKFHKGLLLVEPKRFQAIQKEIKSRIYNE